MPATTFQAEATVLLRHAGAEKHVGFVVFDGERGCLRVFQRTGARSREPALDLFDDADLLLSSTNQGQTWFASEVRPRQRRPGIGRSYETLRHASLFASVIARNAVAEEGRASVLKLVRQALDAFDQAEAAPEIVRFKALYSFARDEGYPVRQHWLDQLHGGLRPAAELLLRTPLAALGASAPQAAEAARLLQRLEDYLRAHTEILLE